ncbi:MAG: N-acetylmuramoyl-L-alanine amidase [Elusimicrobia bacterium]|nr:N-acetylmuramoyl-L-alanine amidase [Elusimicrobiota bacterium]
MALGLGLASSGLFRGPAAAGGGAVILDPGHGGKDFGAIAQGRREKDITLSIARKLKLRLDKLGPGARLTREGDDFLALPRRIEESLAWEGQVFVSLHLNKVKRKQERGIQIYSYGLTPIPGGSRLPHLPPLPAPPRQARLASEELAAFMTRALRGQGLAVNPPEKAALYVLKNPRIPSILIELGHLSHSQEAARLADPAYQERLAEALAQSLAAWRAQVSVASR